MIEPTDRDREMVDTTIRHELGFYGLPPSLIPKLYRMVATVRAEERERILEAFAVPDVWPQVERDGMAEEFKAADAKHGHYETLFAVAAWLLRHRAARIRSGQ